MTIEELKQTIEDCMEGSLECRAGFEQVLEWIREEDDNNG